MPAASLPLQGQAGLATGRRERFSCRAVSYTHLDVYKRQALEKARAGNQKFLASFSPAQESGLKAVSYTHLDVYKRQRFVRSRQGAIKSKDSQCKVLSADF